MSNSLADAYTDAIHFHLKQFAAWPVDSGISLGDYGRLEGSQFQKIGNISKDLRINYEKGKPSLVNLVFEYKSAGISETNLKAAASASAPGTPASVNATSTLSFANGHSVYFRSIKLKYEQIDNFATVSSAILKGFEKGTWDGTHVFVHTLFRSGGTTIIISAHAGATIEIEAGAKGVQQIDLADVSLKLKSTHETNVGLRVIASDKLVPLFGLAKIRPRIRWLPFLGGKTVQTMLAANPAAAGGAQSSGQLPGHVVAAANPNLSPDLAKELGKGFEDVFQVEELP
jgi:hypothetical protein